MPAQVAARVQEDGLFGLSILGISKVKHSHTQLTVQAATPSIPLKPFLEGPLFGTPQCK